MKKGVLSDKLAQFTFAAFFNLAQYLYKKMQSVTTPPLPKLSPMYLNHQINIYQPYIRK